MRKANGLNGDEQPKFPTTQGKVGYCNPPVEHRWKPGQSGNPRGGPQPAGLTVKRWLNVMQDWPRSEIESVVKDDEAPAAKRAAARAWLHATSDATSTSGVPIAGAEFDRIMDRTDGRPVSTVDLLSGGQPIYKELAGVSRDEL